MVVPEIMPGFGFVGGYTPWGPSIWAPSYLDVGEGDHLCVDIIQCPRMLERVRIECSGFEVKYSSETVRS